MLAEFPFPVLLPLGAPEAEDFIADIVRTGAKIGTHQCKRTEHNNNANQSLRKAVAAREEPNANELS